MRIKFIYKGGKGSGNFGHAGRPGKMGGSASAGARMVARSQVKPKLPKKATMQQTAQILNDMGYTLGAGRTDLKAKKTYYKVTDPAGNTSELSVDDIRELIENV